MLKAGLNDEIIEQNHLGNFFLLDLHRANDGEFRDENFPVIFYLRMQPSQEALPIVVNDCLTRAQLRANPTLLGVYLSAAISRTACMS